MKKECLAEKDLYLVKAIGLCGLAAILFYCLHCEVLSVVTCGLGMALLFVLFVYTVLRVRRGE